jgi:hypothetical protein
MPARRPNQEKEITLRVFIGTSLDRWDAIASSGFTDLHKRSGRRGVLCASRQLDQRAGEEFDFPLTLILNVPEDVFDQFEQCRDTDYRLAIVPAAVLNRFGRPLVYDAFCAGSSRAEILRILRLYEENPHPLGEPGAREMRDAIAFFDRIGWSTPLKLHEQRFDRATGIRVI